MPFAFVQPFAENSIIKQHWVFSIGIVSDFTDQAALNALNIIWNSSENGVNEVFEQRKCITLYAFINFYRLYNVSCSYMGA